MRPLTQHRQRVITAFFALPILIFAVYAEFSLPFFALTAFCCIFCLFEYFSMVFSAEKKIIATGVVMGFLPVAVYLSGRPELFLISVYLTVLVASFVFVLTYERWQDPFRSWTAFVAGAVYLGTAFAHCILIRQMEHGRFWIAFLLLVIFASDIGAYYAGHAFGKRKLAPILSKGKTVEGAIGGIASGMAVGVCMWIFFSNQTYSVPEIAFAFFTSLLITIVGQAGDLIESLIKRSVGAKDAGSLLPGHGGFFDRLDAVILAAPCLYWMLQLK